MKSPAFKQMATKMVVGMTTGADTGNLIAAGEHQALLGPSDSSQRHQQHQQVVVAQQQEQQMQRQLVERQVAAILDSDAFSSLVDEVVASPAIQKVMGDAADGSLCPDADGVHAVTACMLDAGLLRTVADEACAATGISATECDQVHAMSASMLSRLGLQGDGWIGWVVRRLILRPWLASVLELALTLCVAIAMAVCVRHCTRAKGGGRRTAQSEAAEGRAPRATIAADSNVGPGSGQRLCPVTCDR